MLLNRVTRLENITGNFLLVFLFLSGFSIIFDFFSWFFFISLIIFLLLYLTKNIFNENKLVFYLIIFSFFIKFFISEYIYIINEIKGYDFGTIGGSDDVSYFLRGKFIAEFFKNNLSNEIHERFFKRNFFNNDFFYHFNFIINFIDVKINLKEIIKVNFFIYSLSSIILYNICRNLRFSQKNITLIILLFLIDFKLNFFSNLNLKEIYLIFSSISTIYICHILIDNNIRIDYKIITISIFALILSIFFRFHFFIINFFLILVSGCINFFYLRNNFKFYKKYLFLCFLVLIIFFLSLSPLESLYMINDRFYNIYYNISETENSISNRLFNLKYKENILYFFVHFISGIVGIFPIYKNLNLYLQISLFAQIWTHLLIIFSSLVLFNFIKNFKTKKLKLKILILITFLKLCIILTVSTVATLGSLEFSRYILFLNVVTILFIGLKDNSFDMKRGIVNGILIYVLLNIILLIPYDLLKNIS